MTALVKVGIGDDGWLLLEEVAQHCALAFLAAELRPRCGLFFTPGERDAFRFGVIEDGLLD